MGHITGCKYGYNDINIVPEVMTDIKSRSEVCLYDENGMFPIFTAPMDTVVDDSNYKLFEKNSIYSVIPRSVPLHKRIRIIREGSYDSVTFVALSLNEASTIFLDDIITKGDFPTNAYTDLCLLREKLRAKTVIPKICIDIANGHMSLLISTIYEIKKKYGPQVKIMSGNIANPETYRYYENAGCDYVRVSIGTGEGCSTSTNTGIHYPIFSLLKETYEIKKSIDGKCKIIADGGIKCFGDIQKALIYADYVMIGGLLSKTIESAGQKYYGKSYWNVRGLKILRPLKTFFTYGKPVKKLNLKKWRNGEVEYMNKFKGMSTVEAQKNINKANGNDDYTTKVSEGFVKLLPVEYELEDWMRSEKAYFRSMMSYIGARNIYENKDALWITKRSKTHN